jgi:23S rRNA (cytosine1962-C5)-methyltransferase
MAGRISIKRGKEKPLLNHHPWVFSGAVEQVVDACDGELVEVYDSGGDWLGRGAYNARSQIAVHIWTFEEHELVNREFFMSRLKSSISRRDKTNSSDHAGWYRSACRLVNAESDGMPGLVVDRYDGFLIAQFLTAGIDLHKKEIVDALDSILSPRGIYERSDADVRKKEGLPQTKGRLRGEEPPNLIEIEENTLGFEVDVKSGQKTGFYLDQRENRRRAAPYLRGEVLNAFSYTGGFGVYAARAGALMVSNLDTSVGALDLAKVNFEMNGLGACSEFTAGDAFEELRAFRDQGRRFDAIVLDPPKFVSSQGQMQRGLRGYKDINLLAFQLLRPDGVLVTFSCSGLVSADLFQKVIFGALHDAHREGQILERLTQGPDHPVSLAFPQAEYLKGLIVRMC